MFDSWWTLISLSLCCLSVIPWFICCLIWSVCCCVSPQWPELWPKHSAKERTQVPLSSQRFPFMFCTFNCCFVTRLCPFVASPLCVVHSSLGLCFFPLALRFYCDFKCGDSSNVWSIQATNELLTRTNAHCVHSHLVKFPNDRSMWLNGKCLLHVFDRFLYFRVWH